MRYGQDRNKNRKVLSSRREHRSQLRAPPKNEGPRSTLLLNHIAPEPLDVFAPGVWGEWRFTDDSTFKSPNSQLFEIKKRLITVNLAIAARPRALSLWDSRGHDASLHLSESRLRQSDAAARCRLDYGCGLIRSTEGSQPSDSGVCAGARVQNWQKKADTCSSPSLIWFPAQSQCDCDVSVYHGMSCAELHRWIYIMLVTQWTALGQCRCCFFIWPLFIFKQCFWCSNVPSDLIYVLFLNWRHKS